MHSTDEFLGRMRELNVQLTANGDRLGCSAPKGVLTAALKEELVRRKSEIVARLTELAADQSIPRVPRGGPLPLSPGQRRLWFLQRYEPESCAYNIAFGVRFRGTLDSQLFADSFRAVVNRHEALRTGFHETDGAPHARLAEVPDCRPDIVDIEGTDQAALDDQVTAIARTMAQEPFDLSQPPLIRARIVRAASDHHVLLIVVHHIVADGWSLGVLVRDVARIYRQKSGLDPEALPDLPLQFVDYVSWLDRHQPAVVQTHMPFWKEQLRAPLPVLELPSDRPRPSVATFRGARARRVLSHEVVAAIRDFARREGATPFIVMLSAFKAVIQRYTQLADVIVGSATAGRSRPDVEPLVGLFINTMVLRTSLDGQPTGRELIGRVRNTVLNASAHAELAFDELVAALPLERDLSHAPLVQVLFTLQNFPIPDLGIPGVEAEPVTIDTGIARLDLTVEAVEYRGEVLLDFEYNADLFDAATIGRMQAHFERLLLGIIDAPDQKIGLLPILTAAEEAALAADAGASRADYPDNARLNELIDAALQRTPDRIAVRCGEETRTCAEVRARSTALAASLNARGVNRGDVVAVCIDRSVDMPVTLLGVLKSGAAYVPLDPIYPADRLAYMLEDSGARIVVADPGLADRLPAGTVPVLWLESETWDATAGTSLMSGESSDLAYILYTSGSTGRPKGVEIEHRALVNFLESMRRSPGLTVADRLVAVTTLCFDIAGLEMFLPLLTGAELIVAPRAAAADPNQLQQLLTASQATVMQATPATWRMLLASGWTGHSGLRVLCGGEALPRDLADSLLAGGNELWNLYGPTETTIWSTVERIVPGSDPITVGTPIANTTVHVLDANLQPLPVGLSGELYIGGDGVARGYHNRPDLTERAFIPDPRSPGHRIYRTGDLARRRSDGRLELLGRMDRQVKIRGYRVELGEIEAALQQIDEVTQGVVVIQGSSGDERLVAFVTAVAGAHIDAASVRAMLARTLPDYMVPAHVIELPAFPLTPNGKVDRKALPSATAWQSTDAVIAPPSGRIERDVAEIWQSLLKVDRVARNDNFFDIGGHSLLVVQMQSRLRARFGRDVPLVQLFQRPTITGIASLLQVAEAAQVS